MKKLIKFLRMQLLCTVGFHKYEIDKSKTVKLTSKITLTKEHCSVCGVEKSSGIFVAKGFEYAVTGVIKDVKQKNG